MAAIKKPAPKTGSEEKNIKDIITMQRVNCQGLAEKSMAALKSADLTDPEAIKAAVSKIVSLERATYKPVDKIETGFRLLRVGEIEVKPPKWMIKDFIEGDALVEVFGDPGSGKSFMAVDIACCVATGIDFHDRDVHTTGPVIYVAGEGRNGLARRFRAWSVRNRRPLDDAPLFISSAPAGLCDHEQEQMAARAFEDVKKEYGPPRLIIIDTVARNFGPGDENSTRDMTQFIQAVDRIRAEYRATVLLVHHSGHGDKSRARGAMALKGALDAEYRVDKQENSGIVLLNATKMKDAEMPPPMAFELRSVELGLYDEDGAPVTSAILDEIDFEISNEASDGSPCRGKWQKVAFDNFQRLLAEHRQRLIDGGNNPEQAMVKMQDLRNACCLQGMQRQNWHRVIKSGIFKTDDTYVFLP